MTSPFVQEQAKHVAARLEIATAADDAARTTALFRTVFERTPTADEAASVQTFLSNLAALPASTSTPAWQYGYGEIDVETSRVASFTPLEHWTGTVWQVGAKLPDEKLGHVSLRAEGGHPGHTAKTATIVRWTAPRSGTYAIDGVLKHPSKEGNGVAGHVASPRLGRLGLWTAEHNEQKTDVAGIVLEAGDVVDFVVEPRGNDSFDSYSWSPKARLVKPTGDAKSTADGKTAWSAADDFHGPLPKPLSPWEMLAQVLLMSNEFMFVD
jgi:hypothetical protein